MSLSHYKAIKQFEREGETVQIGTELILSNREAEDLLSEKAIMPGRALDPEEEVDRKMIEEAEAAYEDKYEAAMAKEEARDEKKSEDLAEDDNERSALINEATEIVLSTMEEDIEGSREKELTRIEVLSTAELVQYIDESKKVSGTAIDGEDAEPKPEPAETSDTLTRGNGPDLSGPTKEKKK